MCFEIYKEVKKPKQKQNINAILVESLFVKKKRERERERERKGIDMKDLNRVSY